MTTPTANKPYRDYADFLADHFVGKMQKISINAGLSCPNRDGTIGRGGCTYCNNQTFNPDYCQPTLTVAQQLERGKQFFARKYPHMRYLAYFQAYTSTHAHIDRLLAMYDEALATDGVEGLIIGTRPDCMPESLLEHLARLHKNHFVMIEYGAESSHDSTLTAINRCHSWADTCRAAEATAKAGLPVGLHLIMGLPGETPEMMLQTIDAVNALPVSTIKIHQLQLIRGTRMAADVEAGRYTVLEFTVDSYIDLCANIINRLRPDIAIERFTSQSPDHLLISPRWGLKNYQFTHLLHQRLKNR